MKPAHFLLGGLLAASALAQGLAPDSLANHVYTIEASEALGIALPPPTSGVLTATGLSFRLSARGRPLETAGARYSWTKTGPNEGRFVETTDTGTTIVEVRFSAPGEGTFRQTVEGADLTITGKVYLSPIPQPAPGGRPPLVNIATRTTLAAGGTVTAGFVIGGDAIRRVLVRAIGPGLRAFGVDNAMANPTLAIHAREEQIAANDDHGGATDAAAVAVGAFALAPASADAALVASLPPGAYTVLVRPSAATGAGEVLVEVYHVE